MSGIEMKQCDVPDILAILSYLSQVYDTFRREIPHIKHPKLVLTNFIFFLLKFILLMQNMFIFVIHLFIRKIVIIALHQQKVVLEIVLPRIIIILLLTQKRQHY